MGVKVRANKPLLQFLPRLPSLVDSDKPFLPELLLSWCVIMYCHSNTKQTDAGAEDKSTGVEGGARLLELQ